MSSAKREKGPKRKMLATPAAKPMKIARFTESGRTRLGVVEGDFVVDLSAIDPLLPSDMATLLELCTESLESRVARAHGRSDKLPLASVRLEAPLARPPKILAVGLNYADHIRETGAAPPTIPIIFNKQSTSVVGPGAPILIPPESAAVDYEGELAVVIGRRCRRVSRDRAAAVIAGFTICNDVSVRDWQRRTPTMTMGKSWDSHCPLGPWIVTIDEIPDPSRLELVTRVNGEVRQRANTREMIFDCFALVEHLSTAFTLEPGDVISTGTPAGVGGASQPPRWLVPGDTVAIRIQGIGELSNPVVAESSATGVEPSAA
jgi:2-keto-4-pentenoate hydratase/2-oxohepta-3-ene-1,7-dioic acid hydratase in catechol pathway